MILVTYLISMSTDPEVVRGGVHGRDGTISLCPYKVVRIKTGHSCERYSVSVEK